MVWSLACYRLQTGRNRPSPEQAVTNAEVNFAGFAGFFGAMGVVIIMQGVIIDEKKSGTAAWIASKPVSRTSFILSKLIANTAAILIVIYVVQGVLVYLQFALLGSTPPLGPYVFSLALLGLHLLFYLTLTLMLGTLFNERGPVIGIPLAILFASQFLMSSARFAGAIYPLADCEGSRAGGPGNHGTTAGLGNANCSNSRVECGLCRRRHLALPARRVLSLQL